MAQKREEMIAETQGRLIKVRGIPCPTWIFESCMDDLTADAGLTRWRALSSFSAGKKKDLLQAVIQQIEEEMDGHGFPHINVRSPPPGMVLLDPIHLSQLWHVTEIQAESSYGRDLAVLGDPSPVARKKLVGIRSTQIVLEKFDGKRVFV